MKMTKENEKKAAEQAALLEAARQGDYQQLESILGQMQHLKARKKKSNPLASLRKSVSLNRVRDPVTGFTCLHHAALNGHTKCVQLILDCGAKLNALDYKGSSALHLAAWVGNLDVIRVLLHQQPPSVVHKLTHHHNHQSNGSTTTDTTLTGSPLNSLADTVVDVNLCNNDNQTPLSLAAQFGHVQVARELLEYGANLELRSHQLDSPLDLAALNGRLEMVDLLLESSVRLVAELRQPQALITLNCSSKLDGQPGVESLSVDAQQHQQQQQRPSGGWSSLLRGRRESNPSIKSPLQRLTVGTLSMRQPAPPVARKYLHSETCMDGGESSVVSMRDLQDSAAISRQRRATLTSGITSFDQIYPTKNRSSVSPHISQVHRASLSIYQGSNSSEILLDHSPMHYAARRGHANVLTLLFNKYQANVLQVTSLGGILHELALNNHTRHIDVLRLIFKYISKKPNCLTVLNALLELRDSHGLTVFDILKAMNNKSALEMTRSIHECSDHVRAVYSANHSNIIQQYGTLASAFKNQAGRTSYSSSQQMGEDVEKQFASLRRKRPALVDSREMHRSFQAAHVMHPTEAYKYKNEQPLGGRREGEEENIAPFVMTRSVSNLNRVSSFQHKQALQQADEQKMPNSSTRHCIDMSGAGVESSSCKLMKQLPISKVNSRIMSHAAQMVRSQTDCSHLFHTTSKPPKTENSPDNGQRATINRGYHVYEHEFYPPRLLPSTRNFSPSAGPNDELRQTTSLDIASATAKQVSTSRLLEQVSGDSRLSLHNTTAASNSQHHKLPSSMMLQTGLDSQQLLTMSNSNSLNNSQSYDGHLGSHMFENTRQAIMRDFDKMIGKELLNRKHCDIIKGAPSAAIHQPTSEPASLQLSKVHLDMDKQGDRLTVTGLVMLPSSTSSSPSCTATTKPASFSSMPPVAGAARSNTNHPAARISTWLNGDMSTRGDVAPPKPPRLSLLNRNSVISSSSQPPSERPPPPPTELNNNHSKPPRPELKQQMLQMMPHQNHLTTVAIKGKTTTRADQGLLKLACPATAPPDTFPSATISQHAVSTKVDTDSGVCTSNSPASFTTTATPDMMQTTTPSTGNQQRTAVVKHLLRPQLPSLVSSTQTSNHQILESSPPSPNTAQHCIDEVLQMQQHHHQQLQLPNHSFSNPSVANKPQYSLDSCFPKRDAKLNDADYENCIGLQRHLHRCSSLASLMIPQTGAYSSLNSDNPPHIGRALSSDAGTTLQPAEDEDEDEDEDEEDDDDDYASSSNQSSKNCSDSCNSSVECQSPNKQERKCKEVLLRVLIDENDVQSDVGELFYMNPSELKKIGVKRSQADAETITDEELYATLDEESGCIRFSLRKRCDNNNRLERNSLPPLANSEDSSSISSKKSRLSIQHLPPETNSTNTSSEFSIPSLEACKSQEISNQLAHYNKQAALGVERWFMSSNLVGLVEYSPKFVKNGYDNINFLNHPKLMNEECLKEIGIKDESHQMLILDKIRTELNPVDFNFILTKDTLELLNLEEFFTLLQLNHLKPMIKVENNGNWKTTILKVIHNLPGGTRRRILEALQHISEIEKQDTSPKSQVSASSSSSKDSIKSIVSKQSRFATPSPTVPSATTQQEPLNNNQSNKTQSQIAKISSPASEISKSLVSIKAQLRPVAAARRLSNVKPEVEDSPKKVTAHVSVKSVCWPPKSNGQLWSASSPSSDSTQTNINQQQHTQSSCDNNNKARPCKPAPPVKPSKLLAPKPLLMDLTPS